jgi:glutamine amidotransferase
MNVTIVDYNSGNISSVINSFKEVAGDRVKIEVTSDLNNIKLSDKVVLPGQGSFKSCVDALNNINGLVETLNDFAISKKKPLLGICVGLQMFADVGYEEIETKGLGWISGKEKENIFGTQFHPEKSDKIGLKIISNFIDL